MSSSTDASEKLPLTFGIEIEHAFGVNQDVVCSDETYQWLFPQSCTIHPNAPNPPDFDPTLKVNCGMLQAAKILRSKGATLSVVVEDDEDEDDNEDQPSDSDMYSRWNMAQDESVRFPRTADQLYEVSGGRIRMWPGWEFSGLELISPALKVPEFGSDYFYPNGLDEVKGFLDLMNQPQPEGTPYCFLSGPTTAGIHVHIGLQPQPDGQTDIPMDFLRHLAFICLAYEDTITLLHHPQRHSYPRSYSLPHIRSNRFVGRLGPPFPRHRCQKGPQFALEDVFLRLFRSEDNNDLAELLTTVPSDNKADYQYMVRECFVNFTNCFDFGVSAHKRTVEFRQHHGTFDSEDIAHWVVLLTALARAAERKANEQPPDDGHLPPLLVPKILAADPGVPVEPLKTGVVHTPTDVLWQDTVADVDTLTPIIQEAAKYPDLFQVGKKRSLKELFDLLELPVPYRHYWWERAKRYRAEWAAGWRAFGTCLDDEICPFEPVRDNEGWADGELDGPPWDFDAVVADADCRPADQPADIDMADAEPLESATGPEAESSLSCRNPRDIDMTDAEPSTGTGPSRPNVMSIAAITNHPEPPLT